MTAPTKAAIRSARTTGGRGTRIMLRIVPVVVLLAGWEWATASADSMFFPTPSAIIHRVWELWFSDPIIEGILTDLFWADTIPSLGRALSGWLIGAVVGIGIGLIAGQWPAAEGYTNPPVHFLRSLPKPALVPVFLLVFGAGDLMRVALIAFGCTWPVLLNTMQGVRALEPAYRETARAFHVPTRRMLAKVVIPATLPKIAAAMRVTLSLSLIIMVVSEWLLADSGLGFFIINAQRTLEVIDVWSGIVLLGLIGYLVNTAFVAVERRVLAWHRNISAS